MRQFDELLRRGLMEANLNQYETVLDRVPGWEPDFSPRYLRERMRLLADPWSWVRRRARPMWKRIARNIACVLLACTVAFGALMAASPTVRASVFGWLRTIARGEAYYEGPSGNYNFYEEQPNWRPTWIPEGYLFSGLYVSGEGRPQSPAGFRYSLTYTKNGLYPDSRGFTFDCQHSTEAHVGLGYMDGVEIETATVWGREADFYAYDRGNNRLFWAGPGGELFQLQGYLDKETLVKIAESVTEVEAPPLPEYRPGWMPELAPEDRDIRTMPDAVKTEMVRLSFKLKDLSEATLLYAAESIGPLWTPEGVTEEEAVEVNGVPGRFWPAAEMDDGVSGASTVTKHETGEVKIVGRSVSVLAMNTLMWTDPESGISFQLQATSLLPREDLLKIAENLIAVSD